MWFKPLKNKNSRTPPSAVPAFSAFLEVENSKPAVKTAETAGTAAPSLVEKPESLPDFLVDDRHYCHECKNINNGYCTQLEFTPVDNIPRCIEFDAAATSAIPLLPNQRHWDYQHGHWAASAQIVCYDCQHFKSINPHGRGAGLCGKGRQGSGGSSLWWHSDCHTCELFEVK